jgi:ribonuclease HI
VTTQSIVHMTVVGACAPNPGTGGWCAIIKSSGVERVLTGKEDSTTQDRMSLTAALRGFKSLPTACEVHVLTDSSYLVTGMTRWRHNWKRSGWLTRYGKVSRSRTKTYGVH